MNESDGGFSFNVTNPSSDTQKDGLLPVVIRQLLLTNGDVQMFGFTYALISTVAIVRDIQNSATKISYLLEDHTGEITAHFWLEDEDSTKHPRLRKNAYARILGTLRQIGTDKQLQVYKAAEVEHPNEVTTHLLEVLYARFKAERLKKGTSPGMNMPAGISSTAGTSMMMDIDSAAAAQVADPNPYCLNGMRKAVFDTIVALKGQSDDGVSRQELDNRFPQLAQSEMDGIVEYMSAEGMIYTTIDSNHFLPIYS